ncbi:MAG: NB-ARC domain-containing protein, partial [Gammaproteobacteria bacterium]
MADSPRDLVFISYSHEDETWLRRLLIYLKPFLRDGLKLWADPYIRVGDRWERAIDEALESAAVGVILLSQEFLASDFIYETELPALLDAERAGELSLICVPVTETTPVPELTAFQWPLDPATPLTAMHAKRQWNPALILVTKAIVEAMGGKQAASLTATPAASRSVAALPSHRGSSVTMQVEMAELHEVPNQRPHFIPRPGLLDGLKCQLLEENFQHVGITADVSSQHSPLGMQGAGGMGKTVLAIELARDEGVRKAFPDGVYWLEFGQEPALETLQARLLKALGQAHPRVDSVWDGQQQLKEALAGRNALLVLDDLWALPHARAFDVLGDGCRLLMTTRDEQILTGVGARKYAIDVMDHAAARALLAEWSQTELQHLPSAADAIVRACGHMPLAIAIAGAQLSEGMDWDELARVLEEGRLEYLDHPYGNVFNNLSRSVDALPEADRAAYLDLAVFPEDTEVPRTTILRYWAHTRGLSHAGGQRLLSRLASKGLLYLEQAEAATPRDTPQETGLRKPRLRFHDLQRDWLQVAVGD